MIEDKPKRRWPHFYNFRFIKGPKVTVQLQSTFEGHWECIRGIQIGNWFIGGIKGVTRQIKGVSDETANSR